jgi:iron-sulfur cluster assembly protein
MGTPNALRHPCVNTPIRGEEMSIQLTESAVAAISSALAERGHGIGVRLDVHVAGPSGLSYRIEFADALRESDLSFNIGGFHLVSDAKNLPYLQGLVLNFTDSEGEQGFSVSSSSDCGGCGCGADSCEDA